MSDSPFVTTCVEKLERHEIYRAVFGEIEAALQHGRMRTKDIERVCTMYPLGPVLRDIARIGLIRDTGATSFGNNAEWELVRKCGACKCVIDQDGCGCNPVGA